MRKFIILSLSFFIFSSPTSAEFHSIYCDAVGTPGKLLFKDGKGAIRKINVGQGANPFDPGLCQEGLFKGYFVPDSKTAQAGLVYLIVHPRLPAGFATLIKTSDDENANITTLNFYEAGENVFVSYQIDNDEEVKLVELNEIDELAINFNGQKVALEIWYKRNDDKTSLIKLLAQKKENDQNYFFDVSEDRPSGVSDSEGQLSEERPNIFRRFVTSVTNAFIRFDDYVTEVMTEGSRIERHRPQENPFPNEQ